MERPNRSNGLMTGILDQYNKRTDTVTMYGVDIEDLTREELLASVHWLVRQQTEARAMHSRDMSLSRELWKRASG